MMVFERTSLRPLEIAYGRESTAAQSTQLEETLRSRRSCSRTCPTTMLAAGSTPIGSAGRSIRWPPAAGVIRPNLSRPWPRAWARCPTPTSRQPCGLPTTSSATSRRLTWNETGRPSGGLRRCRRSGRRRNRHEQRLVGRPDPLRDERRRDEGHRFRLARAGPHRDRPPCRRRMRQRKRVRLQRGGPARGRHHRRQGREPRGRPGTAEPVGRHGSAAGADSGRVARHTGRALRLGLSAERRAGDRPSPRFSRAG